MDIRKNYAFWCDKNDVKDVCNRVYDLLDKDVVDAKSNTMIVFKNNDCWFFLDIELDGLVCITDLFDASFVKVGCESRKQLRMIKRSNKKYPVAQKAVYKLDYSDDDNVSFNDNNSYDLLFSTTSSCDNILSICSLINFSPLYTGIITLTFTIKFTVPSNKNKCY